MCIIVLCAAINTPTNTRSHKQVMDDRWESGIMEYSAINITGFRIVDTDRRFFKDFLDGWKRLDSLSSLGAGKDTISVRLLSSLIYFSSFFFCFIIKRRNDVFCSVLSVVVCVE